MVRLLWIAFVLTALCFGAGYSDFGHWFEALWNSCI